MQTTLRRTVRTSLLQQLRQALAACQASSTSLQPCSSRALSSVAEVGSAGRARALPQDDKTLHDFIRQNSADAGQGGAAAAAAAFSPPPPQPATAAEEQAGGLAQRSAFVETYGEWA